MMGTRRRVRPTREASAHEGVVGVRWAGKGGVACIARNVRPAPYETNRAKVVVNCRRPRLDWCVVAPSPCVARYSPIRVGCKNSAKGREPSLHRMRWACKERRCRLHYNPPVSSCALTMSKADTRMVEQGLGYCQRRRSKVDGRGTVV